MEKELNVVVELKRMILAKMTYRQMADEIFTWPDEEKAQEALDRLKNISDAMVAIKKNPIVIFNRKERARLIKKFNMKPFKTMFDGA